MAETPDNHPPPSNVLSNPQDDADRVSSYFDRWYSHSDPTVVLLNQP